MCCQPPHNKNQYFSFVSDDSFILQEMFFPGAASAGGNQGTCRDTTSPRRFSPLSTTWIVCLSSRNPLVCIFQVALFAFFLYCVWVFVCGCFTSLFCLVEVYPREERKQDPQRKQEKMPVTPTSPLTAMSVHRERLHFHLGPR